MLSDHALHEKIVIRDQFLTVDNSEIVTTIVGISMLDTSFDNLFASVVIAIGRMIGVYRNLAKQPDAALWIDGTSLFLSAVVETNHFNLQPSVPSASHCRHWFQGSEY